MKTKTKEKLKKAATISAVSIGGLAVGGLMLIGGGQVCQELYDSQFGNEKLKDAVHRIWQYTLYGYDRFFNLGICA